MTTVNVTEQKNTVTVKDINFYYDKREVNFYEIS